MQPSIISTPLQFLFLLFSLLFIGSSLATPIIQDDNHYNTTIDNKDNDDDDNTTGSCKLLDGFAIFIQFSLCFTALLVLLYKRSKESPQRPYQIWALDVSKQFIGAGMIHFINIGISYSAASSKPTNQTNLCTWYFLNVVIDTTLGVFILWCWYRLISATLDLFNIQIKSGEYGGDIMDAWIRQLSLFLLAEMMAKLCIWVVLVNSPWLFWIGETCISWISNEKSQVVFVMLIFPLIMNALQFWLTDTILKEQQQQELTTTTITTTTTKAVETKLMLHHHPIKTTTAANNHHIKKPPLPTTTIIAVLVEQTERTPLLFPPSKHRMSS